MILIRDCPININFLGFYLILLLLKIVFFRENLNNLLCFIYFYYLFIINFIENMKSLPVYLNEKYYLYRGGLFMTIVFLSEILIFEIIICNIQIYN